MSEYSAERKRRTNRLVRKAAAYIFQPQRVVSPEQLFGLCKLTWITNNCDIENAPYIRSTKIPALGLIFERDFPNDSIQQVAEEISEILEDDNNVSELIISHTGFVNFYNAYRGSSLDWIQQNFETLLLLFRQAYELFSDEDGLSLITEIMELPSILNPNGDKLLPAENLLTPVFFALDFRIRFPIINGNDNVRELLRHLRIDNHPLDKQYSRLIELYDGTNGTRGIKDAADLDEIGKYADFIDVAGNNPTKKLLEEQPTTGERELPLKDETDLEILQTARTLISKRVHNQLTNKLKSYLTKYTLLEGRGDVMFDVLVKNYDKKNDLLIEVKSSSEAAHIRMAIGQVFHYWFSLKGKTPHHLAILIPNEPDEEIKDLLKHLDIGILWFSEEELKTCTDWLEELVTRKSEPLEGSDA
jgi:hypothetical protein